ncbi:tail tape measure protein [Phaeobacter sp. A90a-4f]|uniref:tail tape measure protein n=1 Tax=unclassified Phaeobacter TaxID=2621772 RepID=UPI003A89ADE8
MAIEVGALRASASLDAASFDAGAKKARSALKMLGGGFEETSRDAVRSAEAMARAYDVGFEKTATAAQKQLDALLGVDKASRTASASAKAWVGQLDRQSQAYDRLKASIDPTYAATRQLDAATETLNATHRAGLISDKERASTLQMLKDQMQGVGGASARAGKGMSKFGLVANQVGFQIQDVFVSGPMIGWFRAISQQAPQAAGAFSMLGGSIGTILPWLGTAVAVGGALVPILFDLGSASLSLEERSKLNTEALDNLVGALDDYSRYADGARASTMDLVEEFGAFAQDVKETYEYLSGVSVRRALDALQTDNFDLFVDLGEAASAISAMEDALDALERNTAMKATSEQIQTFRENFESLEDDAYAASQAVGLLPEQVTLIKKGFDELRGAQSLEDIQREAKDALDVIRKFYPEGQKLPSALADAVVQLEAIITSSSRSVANTEEATAQAYIWAGAMAGVNAEIQAIMSSLSAIGGGLISNAAKQAEVDALKAGKSIRSAAIEAERFRKELEFDARREGATWLERQAIDAEQYQFEHGIALDAVLDKEREAARSRERNLKKTGSASRKATNQLKKEADAVRASLDPMAAYNRELAELAKLQGLLSKDEMAKAVANLNVELADSLPLVGDLTDTLTEGLFNGFEGTLKDIGQTFKNWLIQMISTAAKNRIMLSLGFGGSLAGTAASAAGGLGGGGGILGGGGGGLINLGANLLGGGQIAQGVMSGLGGIFTGGGLGSSFANLGGLVTGASSGLGAFGAALPALGIVAGGIALLAKGLSREYDGRAVRGSLGPEGFDGFEFDFWDGGFLRGDKQVNHTARPEIQSMLDDGALAVRSSVEEMAAALGLASTAIDDFTADGFTIWLTGPNAGSEEQIAKAFEDQLTRLGDGMADLVLETEDYAKAGEGAYDTLTRLGGSLISANEGFGLLNQSLFEGSLKAAESASALMDAFGGVEQFTVSVGSYFELMFTEVERLAKQQQYAQEALDEAAEQLNLTLPTTHESFRNLVAGLDRTTEEGREAYVTLIGLSDEFSVVHGTAQQAADALNGVGDALSQAEAEARRLKEQNIRDALAELTGAIKEAVDEMQGRLGIIGDRLKLRLKRLQISVGAERDTITASHTALMDQLEGRLGTLEGAAEKSRQLFETLDDAIRDRRRIDAEGREVERRRALTYVQNGGSDPDRLSDALSVLGEDNSADFSNYADYLADYYRTSNIVSERGDAAQTEMTAADMAVSALEQQITLAQSQHEAEMQRLDQILADGQRTYELAMGEYIAAINVENAVTQLNHTAERYTLVSERIETRMEELETIRLNMEQMVAATLDPSAGLPSISEGVFNVVGAVNALGGSIGQMAAGVASVASAQKEANRIAQIKALERTQVVNSRPGAARAAGENGTIGGALEAVGEIRALREEMAGYLGPISKATGATERSLKRVERDGLTTKGAA